MLRSVPTFSVMGVRARPIRIANAVQTPISWGAVGGRGGILEAATEASWAMAKRAVEDTDQWDAYFDLAIRLVPVFIDLGTHRKAIKTWFANNGSTPLALPCLQTSRTEGGV